MKQPRRLALLIGNSDYDDTAFPPLTTPLQNVARLAEILSDPNIGCFDEVKSFENEAHYLLMEEIEDFFMGSRQRDDLLLFYFSGHSMREHGTGELVLAVKNSKLFKPKSTAISAKFIQDVCQRSGSHRRVIILDCSYSGASIPNPKERGGIDANAILTATSSSQLAMEFDEELGQIPNSVFTHFLLEGITTGAADINQDGKITANELFKYVSYAVKNETSSKQTPYFFFSGSEEIIIARNPLLKEYEQLSPLDEESSAFVEPLAFVMYKDKDKSNRKYELSKNIIIGRDPEANISLVSKSVSELHARIMYREEKFVLFDLHSKTGTYVNGELIINEHVLEHEDEIIIGGSQLQFLYTYLHKMRDTLAESWQEFKQAIMREDHSEMNQHAKEVHNHFLQALDLPGVIKELTLNWGFGILLDTGTIFAELPSFAQHILLIYSYKEIPVWEDIEQQHQHETNQLLLILPVETVPVETASLLQTARTRGIDLIFAGYDDLKKIILASKPRDAFRHLIITHSYVQSPFILGGPTSPKMFFGRNQELNQIMGQISQSSFALIAGRRTGKTSILYRLSSRLPNADFYSLYYDCSTTSTYHAFLTAKIRNWQPTAPPNAPLTFDDLFQTLPLDKPLVLLLDEADKLVPHEQQNGWQLFNALRAMSNARQLQVVFGGERTLFYALKDSTSPLYNFPNEIVLGALDKQAVKELVTRPMHQLMLEFENATDIVDNIYEFTAGHPNVVQRLCHRLIDRLNKTNSRKITLSDIKAVIGDKDFQDEDFLSTYWEHATPLEKIISLLMADDPTIHTRSEVRQALANRCQLQPSIKQVEEALQLLVTMRFILQQTSTGYEFAVKAFPQVVKTMVTVEEKLEELVEAYQDANKGA